MAQKINRAKKTHKNAPLHSFLLERNKTVGELPKCVSDKNPHNGNNAVKVGYYLIPIGVAFEGTFLLYTDIICLFLCELGELRPQCWEMQFCNLFIKCFWQQVHVVLVRFCLFPVL